MDEKGFGILGLLVFAAFAAAAVFVFYLFITSIFTGSKNMKMSPPNYTNEYREYAKRHAYISSASRNDYSSYYEFENTISNYSKNYVNKYYGVIFENDPLYISINSLVREGYLNRNIKISNKNVACSGYTYVLKTNSLTKYDTYISCDSGYSTSGYEERFDK